MIPDLATLRDRPVRLRRKQIYGVAALGWRGSAMHWARWLQAYRILALLGVLQAICTQCGASVMYAGTLEPGWHNTLLPAFSIVNAALSGLGMVTAVVTCRVIYIPYIADHRAASRRAWADDAHGRFAVHLLLLRRFLLHRLGGDAYDRSVMHAPLHRAYAGSFWLIVAAALLPIHLLWFRAVRRSALMLFVLGMLVMAGMWGDHFMLLVVTQHHDFLPSSQAHYTIGFWAVPTWIGTIGLFGALLLLALRYVPVASIIESRLLARQQAGVARHV